MPKDILMVKLSDLSFLLTKKQPELNQTVFYRTQKANSTNYTHIFSDYQRKVIKKTLVFLN
jgi:hypothetical protein